MLISLTYKNINIKLDHQNSLMTISDAYGDILEYRSYDAWGRPRNPDNFTYDANITYGGSHAYTLRGYCMHEHLEAFSLINMNGRVYDYLSCRFLSPDNFAQQADNTQSFNRYSYCLNNPLKYTDPSGQFFWMIPIIAAVVFGSANLAIQASNGEIHNFGDGLKAFGSGAIAGFAIGTGVAAGLGVPILGTCIKIAGVAYGSSTLMSVVSGVGKGILTGDWSRLQNTGKTFIGNFYLDSHRDFLEQTWQGISRFSWELPQTTLGYSYSQIRNAVGRVDRVDYFGGATFSTKENTDERDGISIGNFINVNIKNKINGEFEHRLLNDPLFMHEYGHTFDSQIFGVSYLLAIGLPSITGAEWTEIRANNHAAQYFKKFGIDWLRFVDYGYKLNP